MNKRTWKVYGKGNPVLEIWESFNGDLWFITEHTDKDLKYGYARLYHMPDCAEWGTFSLEEIKSVFGAKVWSVDKKNWANIDTYEEGLLQQVA